VSLDVHGDVLIGDTLNQRVRLVAISGTNPGYTLSCPGGCGAWTIGHIYTVAGSGTAETSWV